MKNKFGELNLPDFKTCYKATVLRVMMAKVKTYGSMEQNRKFKRKPIFGQVIFDKSGKVVQWGTEQFSATKFTHEVKESQPLSHSIHKN